MTTETATPPPAAKSAPQPPQQKPATPPPKDEFNNAFSEIDKLFAVAEPESPPKPEPEKPKPDAEPEPDETKEVPADKPKKDDTEQPEKVDEKPKTESKKERVVALRESYDQAKKRIYELEAQLKAPREDPERKVAEEKLEAAVKRISHLENELKESAFERTDEYKQEFEQPIVNAFKNAYADVAEIEVENEDGVVRKLTNDDFNAILQMPIGQATREANKYGPAATAVLLQHRQNILALNNRKNEAVGLYKKKFLERQEQTKVTSEKEHAAMIEYWTKANDEAKTKYPQFFAPEDGDDEGNVLLAKGYEVADRMFNGSPLTPQERVNLHAAVRNKAGAFDRMVFRNRKLAKKIEQLEKELEDFKSSEPTGESTKREAAQKPKTWEDELDELAR